MPEMTLEEYIDEMKTKWKRHQMISDYDALMAENAQLKASIEQLKEKPHSKCWSCGDHFGDYCPRCKRLWES